MSVNKPRFRNALKKLRQVRFDRSDHANVGMAPQEMLDFLAMLAGLKPVCLVGRGFDDPDWVAGVEALARGMNLNVISGPKWHAQPEHKGLPDWYAEVEVPRPAERPVLYICKSRSIAGEVRAVCTSSKISMEQEAHLLGYPPCCVRDHYRRSRMFHEGFTLMLHRTSGGDEDEMRRILREDEQMIAETEQEKTLLGEATVQGSAPFTSLNMCPACSGDPDSPAMRMSRQYEALARVIDPGLVSEISWFQDALRAASMP